MSTSGAIKHKARVKLDNGECVATFTFQTFYDVSSFTFNNMKKIIGFRLFSFYSSGTEHIFSLQSLLLFLTKKSITRNMCTTIIEVTLPIRTTAKRSRGAQIFVFFGENGKIL